MIDYNSIFLAALENLIKEYKNGTIKFDTESDLQCYLFYFCVFLMTQNQYEKPYKIRTNFGLISPKQKIDLVLGDKDVAVEIKYEPSNILLPQSRRPVVLKKDIEKDFEKIKVYRENGVNHCYFLLLDEDGQHKRRMSHLENWQTILVNNKENYLLLYS